MPSITTPITISGPLAQYPTDAIVDEGLTFTSVPTPALIEMGIEPVRVVRVASSDGSARFQQLGRALVSIGGVEDVIPVLFGEPGTLTTVGSVTLGILLLAVDSESRLVPVGARQEVSVRERDGAI